MPAIALSPQKPLEPITLEKRGVESPSSVLDFGEEPMKAVEIADLPAPEEEEEGDDDEEDDAGELAAWEAKIAEKLERSYHLPVKQLIELEKRSVRCRSAAVRARWHEAALRATSVGRMYLAKCRVASAKCSGRNTAPGQG